MPSSRRPRRASARNWVRRAENPLRKTPNSLPLLAVSDNGPPLVINPTLFIAGNREPGWGPFLSSFIECNREAFSQVDVDCEISGGRNGAQLQLRPGQCVGAIPIRSPTNGKVSGGLIIHPRFGWSGVGTVLSAIGWGFGPKFLELPFVPGSGRQIPPWVLAGPVLARLKSLLKNLKPGFEEKVEIRNHPRGSVQWNRYIRRQLTCGKWHQLPCKFSELGVDSNLRRAIRWTLEVIQKDLNKCSSGDRISFVLSSLVLRLLDHLQDVVAKKPFKAELDTFFGSSLSGGPAFREGITAMGWIVDERGLGGGQDYDGLSWVLQLDSLWERYVEQQKREEAALTGGQVLAGRLGETTVPIPWNIRSHQALGHLVPDIIVKTKDGIEIIDAKYKSHFAALDAEGWRRFSDDTKDSLRADIHQVLAYASVFESSIKTTATLVYPVTQTLYDELKVLSQDIVAAKIPVGTRLKELRLQAMPFSGVRS